ncbi:hypothetical protein RhiJN_00222 [Ceratobasidium sp. AG-Ba]|nr:hypothetical protein RhiJN_00222 [Ceratobasidium sp. AG-Ba]QRW01255.1 hypothetical protein RhiLY_00252 [Ceratobasidium sp. AG-Ba]
MWQYSPSILRRLLLVHALALRINRLAQTYRSIRQLLTPRSLIYATFTFVLWVVRTSINRTGLLTPVFAASSILTGYWHKIVRLGSSIRVTIDNHFNPLVARLSKLRERTAELWLYILGRIDWFLVEPCSQFASSFWSCTLSHAMTCVVSEFNITRPFGIWAMVSRYPLSFFTGFLTLIVMWRCVCKILVLGGLGVDMLAYAYLVVISRFARTLSPLRLVYWVVLVLSVKHVFEMNELLDQLAGLTKYAILAFIIREDILARQLRSLALILQKALLQYTFLLVRLAVHVCIAALWLVTRLVFKCILVPAVRGLAFQILCWACIAFIIGCVVTATVTVEVFAALLVPVYYMDILPSEDTTSGLPSPALPFRPGSPSSASEEVLSTPPSPSSSSHSNASEDVRRLSRLINAYLDESESGESAVELEGQFKNTPSMHAPPPAQMISPPTHFPLPTTLDFALNLNFNCADGDEEVLALAAQFSRLHIKPELSSVPKEPRRPPHRSTITIAAFSPSSHYVLVTPIRE